ncbi:hypothetical protein Pelo_6621 [Pelomyxa schiedti]|nr:hypothetical protein Pelo_6621 [Pelomyxa schiedti]
MASVLPLLRFRRCNSGRITSAALALHLQHYDEPDIWFATIMADIFYPFGTKLSLSWLKKRLECNVNIMNACASHGSIVTARNLLRDYIKQFGFFPAVVPGALYFAISHCQFDFLQEWVSDSPFRVLFNSSDQNELLPTRLLQDGRNRNLYVAICMGIALAWRSASRATDQADKARFESKLTRLLQLINTGLLMTTHNYRRELLEIASYAGALPLVEVIFEKSKKFLIFDDYDPREPFMNSLHNAAAGGNHDICQLLLLKTSVRGSFPFNLSLSTLLLSAVCRNQQYFTEICNMLREAFVKTSLWTLDFASIRCGI